MDCLSFIDVPANITGLDISYPYNDQISMTAMITWDPLSGSEQTGISDGCDDTVAYNLVIYIAYKGVVHEMDYSVTMATVKNLDVCTKYTLEIFAYNKLQEGKITMTELGKVEKGKCKSMYD